MASFRFCETYSLHIKLFVVNKSAISPFLGGVAFGKAEMNDSTMHVSEQDVMVLIESAGWGQPGGPRNVAVQQNPFFFNTESWSIYQ